MIIMQEAIPRVNTEQQIVSEKVRETEVLMSLNNSFSLKWYMNLKKNVPTACVLFPELANSKSQDLYASVKEGMGTVNRCSSLAQEKHGAPCPNVITRFLQFYTSA